MVSAYYKKLQNIFFRMVVPFGIPPSAVSSSVRSGPSQQLLYSVEKKSYSNMCVALF